MCDNVCTPEFTFPLKHERSSWFLGGPQRGDESDEGGLHGYKNAWGRGVSPAPGSSPGLLQCGLWGSSGKLMGLGTPCLLLPPGPVGLNEVEMEWKPELEPGRAVPPFPAPVSLSSSPCFWGGAI